jgi:type IV secretion system protein TrbL
VGDQGMHLAALHGMAPHGLALHGLALHGLALHGLALHGVALTAAVPAFGIDLGSFSPMNWLGDAAAVASADGWKGAMVALWSAAMWALAVSFRIIDAFADPDLSPTGPLRAILPYTFGIGASVAALMVLLQLGAIAWKRDGQSLARLLVGTAQFGAVWTMGLTGAGAITAACAGLTRALLVALLHVDSFAALASSFSGPRQVSDTVAATVLGLTGLLVVLPAALGYVFIQLARCAALMILTTTSAISAAGLTSQIGRTWFWKSLRWFISASLISPLAALVLGIGVKISQGVVAGSGDKNAAAVGMALVSAMLILIGAVCPLIVFRMLAFVDPGTSSGSALRTSFAASGGVAARIAGKGGGADAGGSAGTRQDVGGRSMGESDADSQTQGRFAQSMSALAGGLASAGSAMASGVSGSSAIGADVLGAAGVGHQSPYFGQSQSASSGSSPGSARAASSGEGAAAQWPDTSGQGVSVGDPGGLPALPPPPMQPPPVQPPPPPVVTGPSAGSPGGPGGAAAAGPGAGAVGGAAGAAEAIPVLPL